MGKIYVGESGKQYAVSEPALGEGYEAMVYAIPEMPDLVLKEFKSTSRMEAKEDRLHTMLSIELSPEAKRQLCWPLDVVYDGTQLVGYVMPGVQNGKQLSAVFGGKEKSKTETLKKVLIAKNLCAAVQSMHNVGQVCGDLSPANILVDPESANVTLTDTDSYQITDPKTGRVYRCEVGNPRLLPRELQLKLKQAAENGQSLRTVALPTFTKYTDLFALGIHIFSLLMEGAYPYASSIDPEQKPEYTVPPAAANIRILPKYIRDLFERTFSAGLDDPTQRPDAVQWYQALTQMQKELAAE